MPDKRRPMMVSVQLPISLAGGALLLVLSRVSSSQLRCRKSWPKKHPWVKTGSVVRFSVIQVKRMVRRSGVYAMTLIQPLAQIDQPAALAAEGPPS